MVVQTLYNLPSFRRIFGSCTTHDHHPPCVICALKGLFADLDSSHGSKVLQAEPLRTALAGCFRGSGRFRIGAMDDAIDCYNNLLIIMESLTSDDSEAFSLSGLSAVTMERNACPSRGNNPSSISSADRSSSLDFVVYLSASALSEQKAKHPKYTFDRLLKNVFEADSSGCSDDKCKIKQCRRVSLLNTPQAIAFGLTWATDSPDIKTLKGTLRGINTSMNLSVVYDCNVADAYILRSMICYYGKHYAAFIFDQQTKKWMYCDDEIVRQVGSTWDDVLTQCESGKWQPQLLVFETSKPLSKVSQPITKQKSTSSSSPTSSGSRPSLPIWIGSPEATEVPLYEVHPDGNRGQKLYDTVLMPPSAGANGGVSYYDLGPVSGASVGTASVVYDMPDPGSNSVPANSYGSVDYVGSDGYYCDPSNYAQSAGLVGQMQNMSVTSYNPQQHTQQQHGGVVYDLARDHGTHQPPSGTYECPVPQQQTTPQPAVPTPSTPYLDRVQQFVGQAMKQKSREQYAEAARNYGYAATQLLDMVENLRWPPSEERRQAVAAARRYNELSSKMTALNEERQAVAAASQQQPPSQQQQQQTSMPGVYYNQ